MENLQFRFEDNIKSQAPNILDRFDGLTYCRSVNRRIKSVTAYQAVQDNEEKVIINLDLTYVNGPTDALNSKFKHYER